MSNSAAARKVREDLNTKMPEKMTIIGREERDCGDPTAPKVVLNLNRKQAISYAMTLLSKQLKAEEEELKACVRLGVFLMQARTQIRHSGWRSFLLAAGVHYKKSIRAVALAKEFADHHGELDTARLTALWAKYELHEEFSKSDESKTPEARGVTDLDDGGVSMYKAELAIGLRKRRNPSHAMPPLTKEGQEAVREMGYVAYAKGHEPVNPIVIDGEEYPPAPRYNTMTARKLISHAAHSAVPPAEMQHEYSGSIGTNGPISTIKNRVSSAVETLSRVITMLRNCPESISNEAIGSVFDLVASLEGRLYRILTPT